MQVKTKKLLCQGGLAFLNVSTTAKVHARKKPFLSVKGKGKAVSVYEPPLFQGLLQGYK